MAESEFYVEGVDGRNLYGKCWSVTHSRAVIALLHGLYDHINRYDHLADFFNSKQVAVMGLDHPGHGKTPGKRGHIPDYDLSLAHVETLLIEIRSRFIDQPVFVYGQCLGANLAMNYALRNISNEIRGLILTSPWIRLAMDPAPWKLLVTGILGKIFPSMTIPVDIEPLDMPPYPESEPADSEDSLLQAEISAGTFNKLTEAGIWNLENAGLLNYPVLLQHGKGDKLTSWKATREMAQTIGESAELMLWDERSHELHNGKIKDEVLSYSMNWMEKYI